jgi:hypothetical protein
MMFTGIKLLMAATEAQEVAGAELPPQQGHGAASSSYRPRDTRSNKNFESTGNSHYSWPYMQKNGVMKVILFKHL